MEPQSLPHPHSLLGLLAHLPDPRRRQGRMYPLSGMLGMLILAALNGEGSLRGMWLWASAHWAEIADALGFFGVPRPPALSTVWYALTRLDPAYFEQVLRQWAAAWEDTTPQDAWSLDGKLLRGSQRPEEPALGLVSLASQTLRTVVAHQPLTKHDD